MSSWTEFEAAQPEFAARVPLLVPRWPSNLGPDRFSTALYRKNREYQALMGWLAGVVWLTVRCLRHR